MKMKNRKAIAARSAVALSLAVTHFAHGQEAPAAAPASATPAKDDASAPIQQVVMTGSRIARRDTETSGPMLTLTKDDLKFAAPTSLGDIMQALPNAGVSLNSNGTQGTSYGVSSINLRYLGSAEGSGNRTLVLVDGHRWVNAAGGRGFRDFTDLNTIPLGIIDSVEVLKDGASAIYGADAIAGVVNIHTKRKLDGFEANMRLGTSSRNDDENYNGFLNWGKRFDKGSVFLSGSMNDSRPILSADRDLTKVALSPLTAPGTSPQGLYVLPGLSNNAYFGTATGFASNAANAVTRNTGVTSIGASSTADNSFHTATLPGDYYNQQTQGMYATGPSKTAGLFGRLTYEITPDITAHLEATYTMRQSSQLFSPYLLDIRGSNGYSISKDQAYNPFGTANGVPAANALGFSGSTFRIQRVPVEVGNREVLQDVKMSRLLLGLEGTVSLWGDWNWDATLSYSKNKASFDQRNGVNFDNLYRTMTSPATCAAAPGCVPIDLFGTITPAMADYIRSYSHDTNGTSQTDFSMNATRNLMELQGGPLGIATGYEYRREMAYDSPDPFVSQASSVLPLVSGAAQATTSAAARNPTAGSYYLNEAYAELSAPLLANLPWVKKLELDAAVRYSRYSTVGGKATTKFGVLYRPFNSLLLRGTYSQGFRAPSILELYQGVKQTSFPAVDPCNGGGAGLPGCAGIPTSYNQSLYSSGIPRGVTSGNITLKPESADTYSVGFTYAPEQLKGFSVTLDQFKIKIKDAIASQTATQILTACAQTGTFCNLVQRANTGEILQLTQALVNLSRIEVQGVDVTLRYLVPVAGAKIDAALDLAYLQHYKSYVPQPDGSIVVDERAGKSDQPRSTFPHLKAQASLRYIGSSITAGWKARYIGPTADVPNNAVNGGNVPGTLYHDLQLSYNFSDGKTSIGMGIDNLFDKQPPASAANNPINFDIYTYDVRGRYFYTRVNTKF
ncbi:TonB-dependent receptor [Undibacterium sp. Ji50W]|uniref:TonB-dependent receptor n=1 Tax=Undibacterium sp. Ji50W TaxID=3413041 RepID=UPI003BF45B38